MLTVLKKSVAQGPEELTSPHVEADKRKNGIDLVHSFVSANSGTVCINLGDVGAIAYTHSRQPLLTPRSFAVVNDIFCIFEGILDNVAVLRQQYGLNKSANEVAIVIEAYRTLRDRGPYPADQIVRDLSGKFAFVLYDSTSQSLFTAVVRFSFSSLHFLFFVLDFPLKYLT
jgi:asparagine synthetase B (glutamine-hydrolysing)